MPSLSDSSPDAANLAYARGVAAQQAGDLGTAKEEWRRTLALEPDHRPALYNLAVALAVTKENGAQGLYEKLIALDPAHRDALYNLANINKQQGRNDEARSLYRRLIDAHPDFTAAYVNLAKCHADSGEWAAAEQLLRAALAIEPAHAFAQWNLSHLLLRARRWEEGWRAYEYRLRLPGWLQSPVDSPAWNGETDARRILLWNDQGIGDAIQFLRYAKPLAERGHEVWVLVQENLKTLAATAPGVAGALGPADALPQFDSQAPLLSMPYRLGAAEPLAINEKFPSSRGKGQEGEGAARIIDVNSYLAPPHIMAIPRRADRRAIGLVWAGNQNYKNDAIRSAALADLKPLFALPNIDWFSLQFGAAAAQIGENNLAGKIHDLSPQLHNFADTAAAIAALDLVISIDTSVAHLAGAMGKECWLMLSSMPDWRWAGQETSSLWYPAIKIFRQQTPGDWRGIARQMAKLL